MEGRRIYVKHPSYLKNELNHSGTKGMHWGERLYQYKDGSLTPLGRIHYGVGKVREKAAKVSAEKARVKAEKTAEREKRRYQNKDGTLKLRGKLHYRTMDKYALLSDDEIKQQTNRLQLQKNLESLKRDTSAVERLKSKLGNAIEDVTVSGFKKGAEKLVNHFVDEGVSKLLGTDKKSAEDVRAFTQKMAEMKTNEIAAYNKRNKEFDEAYQRRFGEKPEKGFEYPDFEKSEKEGLKNSNPNENNQQKPNPSENKSEQNKPSESKPKEQNTSEKKTEPSEQELEAQYDIIKKTFGKLGEEAVEERKKAHNGVIEMKKNYNSRKKAEEKQKGTKVTRTNTSSEPKVSSETKQILDSFKKTEPKVSSETKQILNSFKKKETKDEKSYVVNKDKKIVKVSRDTAKILSSLGNNKKVSEDTANYFAKTGAIRQKKMAIKGLRSSGMTIEEIAEKLNVSTSTVERYL